MAEERPPSPALDDKLARLRALAEMEMRRSLPREDGAPAAKRHKGCGGPDAGTGGRFDYGATKELASGIAGFVLTCGLQRENSARKEAGGLLSFYHNQCSPAGASARASSDNTDGDAARSALLAPIKVACRGVVALKLASQEGACRDGSSGSVSDAAPARLVQDMVAALLADIDSGKQRRLQHVQRIIPVQTTCKLEAAAMEAAGGRLAALVAARASGHRDGAADEGDKAAAGGQAADGDASRKAQKLTFGISLKQRHQESSGAKAAAHISTPAEAAGNGVTSSAAESAAGPPEGGDADGAAQSAGARGSSLPAVAGSGSSPQQPLDRGAIISTLAGGFEASLRQQHGIEAAVSLSEPDWVLVVEVLPAGGALYAALCALPRELCVLKPKLHIRPVGNAKA